MTTPDRYKDAPKVTQVEVAEGLKETGLKPGDVVLDYFVGGGTTAVEAKLLGRRCIARDINPGATGITLENLKFSPPGEHFGNVALSLYEPEVSVGNAKDLADIANSSIDLICALY